IVRRLGRRENSDRSPRDRFLGATFGAVRGLVLAMLLVYAAMWFDALRATGNAAVLPEIGDSVAADVTSGVVRTAIEHAVDTREPAGRFGARLAARPQVAAADLQALIDDHSFAELRSDADFWSDVEQGRLSLALRRNSFQKLARDAEVRRRLADLGLVPET